MKKKIIGTAALLSMSLVLGGCVDVDEKAKETLTDVKIPFDWFKNDIKEQQALAPLKKSPEIKLKEEKDIFTVMDSSEKKIEKLTGVFMQDGVMSELADGENLFRVAGSDLLSYKFEQDSLPTQQMAKEIESVPYQKLAGMTLIGMGYQVTNPDGRELFAEMNVVNDTNKFLILPIQVSLDKQGKITKIKSNGSSRKSTHTGVPLTEKSELYKDALSQFDLSFTELKNYPVTKQWKTVDKGSLVSFGQEQGLDVKSSKVLFDAFKDTEGNLGLLSVTGAMHTDEKVEAKTFIEVKINARTGAKYYTFVFDRGTNKVTQLKHGSVFKYKTEIDKGVK